MAEPNVKRAVLDSTAELAQESDFIARILLPTEVESSSLEGANSRLVMLAELFKGGEANPLMRRININLRAGTLVVRNGIHEMLGPLEASRK